MRRTRSGDLQLGQVAGTRQTLTLPAESRDKHLYVAGATGTGKSKFLENLLRQDIADWRKSRSGLLLIDPHGSLYDELVAWLARHQLDRPVVPIDLRRSDWVVGYNVLRRREAEPSVVVGNLVEAMAHVWGEEGTDDTPRFAKWASTILGTLYEKGYTLADALTLTDNNLAQRLLTDGLADPVLNRNWQTAERLKPNELENEMGSTINRLQRFLGNSWLRQMFAQSEASLDLRRALDEGWIILVSLAREGARISREDADLFATLLLSDLWTAAQERGKRSGLRPFRVYLDEFQRFVTPTLAENLDEARGFGLQMVMAHQFPEQLRKQGEHGQRLYDSVMENARSKVVFQLSSEENLRPLAQWLYRGTLDPDEVKHKLYSTTVMDYKVEYQKAYSHTTSRSVSSGETYNRSEGESYSGDNEREVFNQYLAETYGSAEHEVTTEGSSETDTPMLMPQLGKELSHVQFRDLEEQLFRSMAALFDQKQRQCVARLVGMKAPVSLFTPHVEPAYVRNDRVERYINKQLSEASCAVTAAEAEEVAARNGHPKAIEQNEIDEPMEYRRKLS